MSQVALSKQLSQFLKNSNGALIDLALIDRGLDFKELPPTGLLIKTSPNTWHLADDIPFASGSFGEVRYSNFNIELKKKQFVKQSQQKIVKILQYDSASVQLISDECHALKQHGIKTEPLIRHDEQLYIVMDDCGVSLDQCMPDPEKFDWDTSFNMAYGLLNDLFKLEKNDIVHRDLKPANICRKEVKNKRGISHFTYRFIDFGLAKSVDFVPEKISGTPLYIAPEMLEENGLTQKSDIYALAGILLEIFGADYTKNKIGYPVFEQIERGFSADGIFGGILEIIERPLPENIDRGLLRELRDLLLKMGDKNPQERPSIEYILKFFSGIPYRMEENKKRAYVSRINGLTRFLGLKLEIPFPSVSHKQQIEEIMANNWSLNEINNTVELEQLENIHTKLLALRNSFLLFRTSLLKQFAHTNSDGIKKIKSILADNSNEMETKFELIYAIAVSKTKNTLTNRLKRCSIFGSGRSQEAEELYKKLAEKKLNINDVNNFII